MRSTGKIWRQVPCRATRAKTVPRVAELFTFLRMQNSMCSTSGTRSRRWRWQNTFASRGIFLTNDASYFVHSIYTHLLFHYQIYNINVHGSVFDDILKVPDISQFFDLTKAPQPLGHPGIRRPFKLGFVTWWNTARSKEGWKAKPQQIVGI